MKTLPPTSPAKSAPTPNPKPQKSNLRNLGDRFARDGTITRREAEALVDEALRDGTITDDEKKDLEEVLTEHKSAFQYLAGDVLEAAIGKKAGAGTGAGAGQKAGTQDAAFRAEVARLTPADFASLAGQVDKDLRARLMLMEGIRQGRPGAAKAVRNLLCSTDGDGKWRERSREAAQMLSELRSFLGEDDLKALRECTVKRGHDDAGHIAGKALDPFSCADPLARDAEMQVLAKGAAEGDRKCLVKLCALVRNGLGYYPSEVRHDAASVLSDLREKLGPEEWSTLSSYAGDRTVGGIVSSMLQDSARAGDPGALDGLAAIATKDPGTYTSQWAARMLAESGKHLQPRHYDALAATALSTFDDSAARQALVFALREGKEGAAEAAKKAFKAKGVDAGALDGAGLADKLEEGPKQAVRYRHAASGLLTPPSENRRVLVEGIRAKDPAALQALRGALHSVNLLEVKEAVGACSEVRSLLEPQDLARLESLSKLTYSWNFNNADQSSTVASMAKAAFNPLTCLDPKTRGAALEALTKKGDAESLRKLAALMDEDLSGLPAGDRQALLKTALDALRTGSEKGLLDADSYGKLLWTSSKNEDVIPAAAQIVGDAIKAGKAPALQAARDVLALGTREESFDGLLTRTVDLLAAAPERINSEHVGLMKQVFEKHPARGLREAIVSALEASSAKGFLPARSALPALKSQLERNDKTGLNKEDDAYLLSLDGKDPRELKGKVEFLEKAALLSKDHFGPGRAAGLLARAASATPPVPGALDALMRVLEKTPSAASGGDREQAYVWEVAGPELQKLFTGGDAALKKRLAPAVLESVPADPRVQKEAFEQVKALAQGGDPMALRALVVASHSYGLQPLRKEAADTLMRMVADGKAPEVVDALLKAPANWYTPELLGRAAARLEPDDKRLPAVHDALRKGLQGNDQYRAGGAADGMMRIIHRLPKEDLEALALREPGQVTEGIVKTPHLAGSLAARLDELGPEARKSMLKAIANAIQRTPKAWTELWRQAQDDLVRHAVAQGDPEIKKALLGRLKPPPVGGHVLQELGQDFTEKVAKRMETALKDDPTGDMARMARLLKAIQMGEDQNGRGYKPGAINRTVLMQKLEELQQKPEVQAILNGIKQEVLSSPKAKKWAKDQEAYINSADFQHALALLPAGERRDFLNTELVKLTSLSGDPEAARRVLAGVTMREMEANPGVMLSQVLKAPGGKDMLKKTTAHVLEAGPVKDAKHAMTCAHEICEAMEELKHLEHEAHPGTHVAGHLGKKADELEKLVKVLRGALVDGPAIHLGDGHQRRWHEPSSLLMAIIQRVGRRSRWMMDSGCLRTGLRGAARGRVRPRAGSAAETLPLRRSA